MDFLLSSNAVYVLPVVVAVLAGVLSYMVTKKPLKNVSKAIGVATFASSDSDEVSVWEQFPLSRKMSLQTRVANAATATDLLQIFNDYKELDYLRLATKKIETEEVLNLANEQAFRDLVRERIVINDVALDMGENNDKSFKIKFHAKIEDTISMHISDPVDKELVAKHICCHLSRTRAGGDSFFAVQDIFATPQFTITTAAASSHPPTRLAVTKEGWAVIYTISNFDVYSKSDLSGEDDLHPEALVTISALVEEAVPLTKSAKLEWIKFAKENRLELCLKDLDTAKDTAAFPVSRTLRLKCIMPISSAYYGYPERNFSSSDAILSATANDGTRVSPREFGGGVPPSRAVVNEAGPSLEMEASALSRSPRTTGGKEDSIMQDSINSLREKGALRNYTIAHDE